MGVTTAPDQRPRPEDARRIASHGLAALAAGTPPRDDRRVFESGNDDRSGVGKRSCRRCCRRLLRTNNRSATRPDPSHPVRRHDVGRARAPDRTALDDRRYRNEARLACKSPRRSERIGSTPHAVAGRRGAQPRPRAVPTPWGGSRLPKFGFHSLWAAAGGPERCRISLGDDSQARFAAGDLP